MKSKRIAVLSGNNLARLMLTLGLAVVLPAAALIYVSFNHLRSIERDKKVEALIHRDFQEMLAISEKKINQKAYTMMEEVRDLFPFPDADQELEKERKLDLLPQLAKDRVVLGGLSFEPNYLNEVFFPEMLEELVAQKSAEKHGNRLAMVVYPMDSEGGNRGKVLAASAGWNEGKAEVSRNLDGVFHGLALGIKFQGTTVEAIGHRWVLQSFLILGMLSVLMIGGLVLAYRSVNRQVALARLKSDLVSNVSHELRTPLALIRLYAETLELGRIRSQEKKEEYYRIIRKESERLTALINNILDFSRIEAGRKEYDFRETDIAEQVRHITQAHGGEVEVESTPGRGSKFTLSLPLATASQPPASGATSGATAS